MKKIKIYLSILTLSACGIAQAQVEKHTYKQQLQGVQNEWHTLDVPPYVLSKAKTDLGDIRIMGITKTNDTVTAPYVLDVLSPSTTVVETPLKIINQVRKGDADYATLQPAINRPINTIKLDFAGNNFDYRVQLEGSNNNSEWFTIIENYRVLSINTDNQNYRYTDLIFPDAKYSYYRIRIPKKESDPKLAAAKMLQTEETEELVNNYDLTYLQTTDSKNVTTIDIRLGENVPLSTLELGTSYKTDFIRAISIRAVTDSFKTEKGWKESLTSVYDGSFTSFENHVYHLRDVRASRLKVMIYHKENTPFDIDAVKVKGYKRRLTARFDTPAQYALYYGNEQVSMPNYDIALFKDKIPTDLQPVTLDAPEQLNYTDKPAEQEDAKTWLWVVMGLAIVMLGAFTLKMMRKV